MNKVILMGRLTRDPDVRHSTTPDGKDNSFARFTIAVDRRFTNKNDPNAQSADFISCVAFGRQAEFTEKYLKQGTKITLSGRIQTGSYTNRDGQKVYTTDIVCEELEFAESKASQTNNGGYTPAPAPAPSAESPEFLNIPNGIETDLPFK